MKFKLIRHVLRKQLAPQVRTTLLSAVPVIPRPPVSPVVHLAPGQVIASMPRMISAPRINVVPMPPSAPHIMAPRPPPMVVPAGKMKVSKDRSLTSKINLQRINNCFFFFFQRSFPLHQYHNRRALLLHRHPTHLHLMMMSQSARR